MVDKRLTARLIKSAALLADYPGRAITGTAKSDAAAVDGYYRFIEQPADSQVTVVSILTPHRAQRAADAQPGHRAVSSGRLRPQLRDSSGLRGVGDYREQPDQEPWVCIFMRRSR